MFGAVEGLLLFLCGSGEYDELILADMLSTLAKSILALCRQGSKNQKATEQVGATYTVHQCTRRISKRARVFFACMGTGQVAPCVVNSTSCSIHPVGSTAG